MAGWLFKATQYCCANVRKGEGRRKRREREVAMGAGAVAEGAEFTTEMLTVLDEGLARLGEKERAAILVRFLEKKTAAESGAAMGVSAEAIEKRIERGVGKLRAFFAAKGYVVPTEGVVGLLGAEGGTRRRWG